MEITYEEILESYNRPFGHLNYEKRNLQPGVLKKLFSEGRIDIVESLSTSLIVMPVVPEELTDIILATPVDKMGLTITHIISRVPDQRLLRKIMKNLCSAITETNIQPAVAIRSILRRDVFWRFDSRAKHDTLTFLKKLFSRTSATASQAIIIGHHDPQRIGFLEDILTEDDKKAYTELIEILLQASGIEYEYIIAAFERHEQEVLHDLNGSLIRLFHTITKCTDLDLYTIFFKKIHKFLPAYSFNILYELCLSEHINASQVIAPHLLQYEYLSNDISPNANRQDIIKYCDWLIVTGKIIYVGSNVFNTLVNRLVTYRATTTLTEVLRACHFMPDHLRTPIIEQIINNCADLCRTWGDDLPKTVEILLDALGQTKYLTEDSSKRALLRMISEPKLYPILSYAWNSAMDVSSDKEDVVLDIITTRITGSVLNYPKQLEELINFVRLEVDDPACIQKYSILILNFILEKYKETRSISVQEIMRVIFGSWLKPTIKLPSILHRISSIIVEYSSRDDFRKFAEELKEEPIFVYTANTLLHKLAQDATRVTIPCQGDQVTHLFRKCHDIVMALGSRAEIDNGSVLNSLTRHAAEPLLRAILQVCDNPQITDRYLARYVSHITSGAHPILIDYAIKVGPQTLHAFIDNMAFHHSQAFTNERLKKVIESYFENNRTVYLELILVQFHKNKSDLPHYLNLCIEVSRNIKFDGINLHFGKYIIKRVMSRDRPRWEGIMSEYCLTLNVTYQEDLKQFKCELCNDRLTNNVYQDDRDSFGIYYCGQCAEFLNDTKHMTQITCTVCMEDKVEMGMLQCGHSFCTNCLVTLFDTQASCPVCRTPVDQERTVTVSVARMIEMFLGK